METRMGHRYPVIGRKVWRKLMAEIVEGEKKKTNKQPSGEKLRFGFVLSLEYDCFHLEKEQAYSFTFFTYSFRSSIFFINCNLSVPPSCL